VVLLLQFQTFRFCLSQGRMSKS